jgi:VanZ family protein
MKSNLLNPIFIIRILLISLIVCTLAFIFGQSMLSVEESTENSDAVGGFIAEILPPDTPVGSYVQNNIRKIAHFTEFFILGCEMSVYILLFHRRKLPIISAYFIALTTALIDETIQIFSGRGPEISDVWIDFFGFASSHTLIISVCFLAFFIRKHINKLSAENGNLTENISG